MGALVIRTDGLLGFGKGDDFPQGSGPGHEHDQPVQAEGDPSVGRGPQFQGFQEKSEFFFGFFRQKYSIP